MGGDAALPANPEIARRSATIRPARWPAVRQRRRPHGHGAEQDSQRFRREIADDAGQTRAVCSRAGIVMVCPIEYKVVKESRGLSPLEVRKRSEAFARKFIDIQREQFKRLGVFGDWENPYLTMDPKYEAEILRAFAVFVEKGLGLSIEEAGLLEHRRADRARRSRSGISGARRHRRLRASFRFPIKRRRSVYQRKASSVAIWTTTPWTLPGESRDRSRSEAEIT